MDEFLNSCLNITKPNGYPSFPQWTPAVREIRVWSLGLEDALEKGMATHSSILAWEIPWTPALSCRYHAPCDRTWCDVMWRTLHLFSKSRDPSLTGENTREMQIEGHSTKQGFPGSSSVKNPVTMQETRVQSLGHEDPVEEEVASHTSILAWRIPQIQEPGGLQFMGSQRVRHNWATEQARCKITYKYSSTTSSLWKQGKTKELSQVRRG